MAHRNASFVSEDSGLSNLCFDLRFSLGHHFSVATQVCFGDSNKQAEQHICKTETNDYLGLSSNTHSHLQPMLPTIAGRLQLDTEPIAACSCESRAELEDATL